MLTASDLAQKASVGGNVAFTPQGVFVDPPGPVSAGSATLFVSTPSDALKVVSDEGFVASSVDRDQVWSVEVIVLSEKITGGLAGDFSTVDDLYEAVEELGVSWTVSLMPAAP